MPRYTEERYCHNQDVSEMLTTGFYNIPIILPEEWKP